MRFFFLRLNPAGTLQDVHGCALQSRGEVLFVKKKDCCRSSNASPSSSFGTLLKASFHIRKKNTSSRSLVKDFSLHFPMSNHCRTNIPLCALVKHKDLLNTQWFILWPNQSKHMTYPLCRKSAASDGVFVWSENLNETVEKIPGVCPQDNLETIHPVSHEQKFSVLPRLSRQMRRDKHMCFPLSLKPLCCKKKKGKKKERKKEKDRWEPIFLF